YFNAFSHTFIYTLSLHDALPICNNVSKVLDLKFNVLKSALLRIGRRFNIKCSDVVLEGQIIPFVDEIKYLGIITKNGSNFKRSLDRKSTRLNSSHDQISYAVFCL